MIDKSTEAEPEPVEQRLTELLGGHRPQVVQSADGHGRNRLVHLAPGTSLTAASEEELERLLRELGATTVSWSRGGHPIPYKMINVCFGSATQADMLVRHLRPRHRTMGRVGAIISRHRPTEDAPDLKGDASCTVIHFTTPALSQVERAELLALIPPDSTIAVEQERLEITRVEVQSLGVNEHRIGVALKTPITSRHDLWFAATLLAAKLELLPTHGQADMEIADSWLLRLLDQFPGGIS